jgi:RNA polymerase sigma-70 factor (ECF subfamily)
MDRTRADGTDDRGDLDLLARYRSDPDGETGRRAASTLLARHRGRVYAWAVRVLRDHDDALDVSQVVLLKAWKALPGFDGRSRFSSWLFALTRNECLTALRPRILKRDESIDPYSFLVDDSDPGRGLEDEEEERAMAALLRETLSPVEQQAIWLRCFERMPVDDVTRLLGLTQASGARVVLQSAREKLRRALARRTMEEPS